MIDKKNIQYVSDNYMCSNCGACVAACPKSAIHFETTNIGRMYTKVDEDTCVNCKKCIKACPSIDENRLSEKYEDKYVGVINGLYVGKCLDQEIYENAQSGGICTQLLCYLFDKKKIDCAVVVKMRPGNTPIVSPVLVTSKEELLGSQKSCYTPVALLTVLKGTRKYNSVAVVGLPCHIAGIVNLQNMRNGYSNVNYKIGLICERTLCSGVHDVYASYVQSVLKTSNFHFKIDWKCKKIGANFNYKSAPTLLRTENDVVEVPRDVRITLKDIFTTPRCRVCYDKLNIHADITLGDPWHMSDVDWEKGNSLIITRTETGLLLLEEARSAGYIDYSSREITELQRSQKVDNRRTQVQLYSLAYQNLFNSEGLGILQTSKAEEFIDNGKLKSCENVLKTFIDRDKTYSKEEIVHEANKSIRTYRFHRKKELIIDEVKGIIRKLIKH